MSRIRTLALIGLLGGCRIATVRPLEANGTAPVTSAAFDAATYVESIWSSRVVRTVESEATDCAELLASLGKDPDESARRLGREVRGRTYFLAKGSGTVLEVDQRSRNGLLGVDVGKADGKVDLWVQAGPVVNGMALRDAVGFISFDQFVNQIDYADAGNALNQKVVDEVVKGLRPEDLKGATLFFAGALTREERWVLTPIRLSRRPE